MRRFVNRLAVYFGLRNDEPSAPPLERLTPWTVFAIVVAALIVGVASDAVKAAIGDSQFGLADAVWHGAVLAVVLVIARVVEYRVRARSTSDIEGTQTKRL